MDWIAQNSDALSVIAAMLSALIWVVYLQMFFVQLQRNRRPVILISRSAGRGVHSRLFISNMSAEPIYVTSLIADIEGEGLNVTAIITDNDDITTDRDDDSPSTNEGPLDSGQYMDAGSYGSLLKRVAIHAAPHVEIDHIRRIKLTVVASSGYSTRLVGGSRAFTIGTENGETVFNPESLQTAQLRSPLARRRLRKKLERYMQHGVS